MKRIKLKKDRSDTCLVRAKKRPIEGKTVTQYPATSASCHWGGQTVREQGKTLVEAQRQRRAHFYDEAGRALGRGEGRRGCPLRHRRIRKQAIEKLAKLHEKHHLPVLKSAGGTSRPITGPTRE